MNSRFLLPLILLPSLLFGQGKTIVSIVGDQFYINGKPTYEGRYWEGYKIEGLLMNSRMVQGIFDDLNKETRELFKYPDTGVWDPDRNTNEFVAAMKSWYDHGLLAFTLNMQGGSPIGYGNKNWWNVGYHPVGNPRTDYLARLKKILDKADELGMVVILGYFYFGQDQYVLGEDAVIRAVDKMTNWILDKGYRNVIIEINNECDVNAYEQEILMDYRVHELIEQVKGIEKKGVRLLVGTSYGGGSLPSSTVARISDFILLHGNGVDDPALITQMVIDTRKLPYFTPKPILFNEDDHYNFDIDTCNMTAAIRAYVSWGFFDYRRKDEAFEEGFQTVPVDWSISSPRKKAFFNKLREVTRGDL